MARRAAALALSTAVAVAAACSSSDAPAQEDRPRRAQRQQVEVRAPGDETTAIPGETPAELAVGVSATLFERAPVVVLAPDGDLAAQARAASAAVALDVPLLLTSEAPSPGLRDELARLDARTVLAFGGASAAWAQGLQDGPSVVVAPADPAELGQIGVGAAQPVGPGELTATIGGLPERRPPLLSLDADAAAATSGTGEEPPAALDDLPPTERRDPLDDLLVVVDRDPRWAAAAASARSSGARVLALSGADPRADPAAIEALAATPPGKVVAVGNAFGPAELLRRRLDVAATGVQLPGGRQVLFPHRRLVALYGHPGTAALGVLGEQPLDAAIERARRLAADYDPLVEEPVVPAFEIIATIASSSAGADGNYANEAAVEELRPWVERAGEAGVYVVLDIQPGRTDFLTQAKRYEELLRQPHVGLALDPEWRLGPDQRHLRQIGSVDAAEVNAVAGWLAELTRRHHLPQKLLLLHQFQVRMITGRHLVDTSHDELAVLVHADGFGTHAQKFATWNRLLADPPPGIWWGWKNFHDEDQPMLTPAETVAIAPPVRFVSYQ